MVLGGITNIAHEAGSSRAANYCESYQLIAVCRPHHLR